jgi:hypothetical protein
MTKPTNCSRYSFTGSTSSHRLDELLRATWAALEGGDLTAVDRALRVIQETNKLLGLYTERVGVLGAGELRVVFEE